MMKKRHLIIIIILGLTIYLSWRFIRPMNIFVVDDRFAWPVDTTQAPPLLGDLSASECAACHQEFFNEWQTTIHAQAWTDPYFQTDWQFDGAQHVCRLCHTPLDRQQPHLVLGYRDSDKWDPIMEDNPDFDPKLQHEGVTCTACHYRDGKIVGVLGNTDAPHPVQILEDPNQVCVRCHIVEGERWDTFFRFPPCGTVAEIRATQASELNDTNQTGQSGEIALSDIQSLGCVGCHMPAIERPLVVGGKIRMTRQHLWRGGHDPDMVRQALTVQLIENKTGDTHDRSFTFSLTNTGTAHYLPTGTPDRYLSVELRLLDSNGVVLKEENHKLIRTVIWRPFIIDLWDTRLKRNDARQFIFEYSPDKYSAAATFEATVRYHLLDESRRQRIGYNNVEPIDYQVYRRKVFLHDR